MRVALGALLLVVACANAPPPDLASRCATPATLHATALTIADPVPTLGLARGANDLGLAFVIRHPLPYLAQLTFQRVTLDGTPVGAPVTVAPVDQAIPQPIAIAYDGADYVVCTVIVSGAACFRVDANDHASEAGMIPEAEAVAISDGPEGLVAAWIVNGMLEVGPLFGASTGSIAVADTRPAMARTSDGAVVGYVSGGMAYVLAIGADAPIPLGAALDGGAIAVASAGGAIGAAFLDGASHVVVAVVADGVVHTTSMGAATSVSIAALHDGFFATGASTGGVVGTFVDLAGTITGAPYALAATDGSHAVVGVPSGLVLAAGASPPQLAWIGCAP